MQTYTLPMETLAELVTLQLQEGGRARLTVTGSSMLPMLHSRNDSVDLRPVVGYQKKGAVILYRRENGQYVLHRIVRARNGSYICCGDNQYMREPVEQAQLLAVVDGFTRKGRHGKVTDWYYRIYTAIWVGLFPLRGIYIFVRRLFAKLRRKLHK